MSLVAVGLPLFLIHRYQIRREQGKENTPAETPEPESPVEECCGMHITCEKDSLLAAVSADIEYYDDEELDRHSGRDPLQYSDEEVEEFRDILLTMMPEDIAGWARSLQLRQIELPPAVREELIMIISEARAARNVSSVSHA